MDILDNLFQQHPAIGNAISATLRIASIVLLYWAARSVLYRLIDATLTRLVARQGRGGEDERTNRLRTLQGLVKSVVGYMLVFVMLIMVLEALTVNVTGIVTTAGVGGLAIGFGAQKLVKDVISGFFLIMEDQYVVGDYVTIGAATGVVEEIGMRITRLRDDQGKLWILSNGDISIVTNHSRAPVEAFIEVGIAPTADVQRTEEVINEVGDTLFQTPGHRLLAAPRALGVSGFDAARTVLRVAVVSEPRALVPEQMRVRQAVHERLVKEAIPIA